MSFFLIYALHRRCFCFAFLQTDHESWCQYAWLNSLAKLFVPHLRLDVLCFRFEKKTIGNTSIALYLPNYFIFKSLPPRYRIAKYPIIARHVNSVDDGYHFVPDIFSQQSRRRRNIEVHLDLRWHYMKKSTGVISKLYKVVMLPLLEIILRIRHKDILDVGKALISPQNILNLHPFRR